LQAHIARELRMKRTPTLEFLYDDTSERALRLQSLIQDVAPKDAE
jgi:ribosome-binding factor A